MFKLNEDLFEDDDLEILEDEFVHPGVAFVDDFGKKWVFDQEFADAYNYYIWSAIDEEGNTNYFVVDQNFYVDGPEDVFYKISAGPLKTYEEAQEKFGAIVDKLEDEEEIGFKEALSNYKVEFNVNGKKTADTVSAENDKEAEKLIKDKYKGSLVTVTNKQEIKEDFNETISDETPEPGLDTGAAGLLIQAINDEWSTIDFYNNIISTLSEKSQNDLCASIIDIVKDITAEENNHVGMLQKALALISPNIENIKAGEEEAQEKIDEVKNESN